jgi:hypothetical protein
MKNEKHVRDGDHRVLLDWRRQAAQKTLENDVVMVRSASVPVSCQ